MRGVSVAVAAKSAQPHKTLPGTIHSVVDELDEIADRQGSKAKALAVQLDVRDAEAVEHAVEKVASHFGGLDILASAISLGSTIDARPKVYDLVNGINARGTWLTSRFALPHLYKSAEASRNPHILTLSPPLNQGMFELENGEIVPSFKDTKALYAMSKCAMSVAAYSLAAEAKSRGVASNALWPYTMIGTSAMRIVNPESDAERRWRVPRIVADTAVGILEEPTSFTGQFVIDEVYLRERKQFTTEQINQYAMVPNTPFSQLGEDLFITEEIRRRVHSYYN